MFRLIKQVLFGLLAGIVNASNHTKCISLRNQQCMTQATFINLHPNEYYQGRRYHSFVVNLDTYVGSCKTLNDLSNRLCVPDKAEDLNLNVFNMITEINKSKTLTKSISCKRELSLVM